jgi:hypothetical protein
MPIFVVAICRENNLAPINTQAKVAHKHLTQKNAHQLIEELMRALLFYSVLP